MAKKPQEPQQPAQEQQPVPAEHAAGEEGGGAFVVDFSGVPDQADLPVVPRGIYDATIDELTFGHSQSSGNPMWTFIFELSESAGEYAGRKMYFHAPFVENMMPRVKKVLSRIAPELLNGPLEPEKIADEGTLLGRPARIRLDIKKYEGRNRNNVRDVLAPNTDAGAGFLGAGEGQPAA